MQSVSSGGHTQPSSLQMGPWAGRARGGRPLQRGRASPSARTSLQPVASFRPQLALCAAWVGGASVLLPRKLSEIFLLLPGHRHHSSKHDSQRDAHV